MRVFVTGGAGYIGSHTILCLLREGHSVLSFDNYRNSSPMALDRVSALAGGDLRTVEGCACDRAALGRAMNDFRPEAVVHLSGLKSVGESNRRPLDYYHNNLFGAVSLLNCMDEFGCDRFVYSSSATVYGEARYLPLDEAHPIEPGTPYGRTKLFIETITRDWCAANPAASAVILRYFNPVGADASGRIGEDPNGIPQNLVPYIAQVAAGRLPRLTVFGDDFDTRDGTGERDYVHISDLAEAHLAALRYSGSHTGCETINVGTGTGITVLEMIRAFEAAAGVEIPHEIAPRRDGDTARSFAATGRAERLLDWKATRGIEEMCASTWRWQSGNPNGYGT